MIRTTMDFHWIFTVNLLLGKFGMVFGYSFLGMAWYELFVNRPVGGYSNNIILDFLVLRRSLR